MNQETQQAYNNGYKKGKQDAYQNVVKLISIHFNIDMNQVMIGTTATTDKG